MNAAYSFPHSFFYMDSGVASDVRMFLYAFICSLCQGHEDIENYSFSFTSFFYFLGFMVLQDDIGHFIHYMRLNGQIYGKLK